MATTKPSKQANNGGARRKAALCHISTTKPFIHLCILTIISVVTTRLAWRRLLNNSAISLQNQQFAFSDRRRCFRVPYMKKCGHFPPKAHDETPRIALFFKRKDSTLFLLIFIKNMDGINFIQAQPKNLCSVSGFILTVESITTTTIMMTMMTFPVHFERGNGESSDNLLFRLGNYFFGYF